jgi:hypothetical protein
MMKHRLISLCFMALSIALVLIPKLAHHPGHVITGG